jgi:hypothetical protein
VRFTRFAYHRLSHAATVTSLPAVWLVLIGDFMCDPRRHSLKISGRKRWRQIFCCKSNGIDRDNGNDRCRAKAPRQETPGATVCVVIKSIHVRSFQEKYSFG